MARLELATVVNANNYDLLATIPLILHTAVTAFFFKKGNSVFLYVRLRT